MQRRDINQDVGIMCIYIAIIKTNFFLSNEDIHREINTSLRHTSNSK